MIESASFLAAMLIGFLGGAHCVGMCGGIVGAMTLNIGPVPRSRIIFLNLAYNSGRIVSYTLAGLLAGSLGFLLASSGPGQITQTALFIFAAFFMLALGLYIAGIWQGLVYLEKAGGKLWQFIAPVAKKFFPFTKVSQGFIAGILWGWLPCGLVYSVLVWSVSSADPLTGAWYMFGFGLGTLPNLMAFGLLAGKLRDFLQKKIVRFSAGMLLIIYAVYMFYRIIAL